MREPLSGPGCLPLSVLLPGHEDDQAGPATPTSEPVGSSSQTPSIAANRPDRIALANAS